MTQNAGHIAQPYRRGRSIRTVCGDSDPCAVFELKSFGTRFFSAPLCGDSDPCGDPHPYGTKWEQGAEWDQFRAGSG